MICIVVFLLCALEVANGSPLVNFCPYVNSMENLDLERLSGVWYERERSWYAPVLETRCHKETYYVDTINKQIRLKAEFLTKETNETLISEITASYHPMFPGTWIYPFPQVRYNGIFKVLNTDYENFAVMYTCESFGVYSVEVAWIVTRTRPTTPQQTELPDDLRNYVGENYYFVYVDQYNCNDVDDDVTSTEFSTTKHTHHPRA